VLAWLKNVLKSLKKIKIMMKQSKCIKRPLNFILWIIKQPLVKHVTWKQTN
jgi:hypothetical protein